MSAEPIQETPAVHSAAVDTAGTTAETTVAPATEAPTAEPIPEASEAAPAIATVPKEDKVSDDAVRIEAQPIAAGNLGYKAPGILNQLRFSSKYFWFGDDALDESTISNYLKTEKAEHKNHNAAHASQTSKGLLLFAKREEDRSAPQGILNLSDASDVTKEGILDFSFRIHSQKHTFQASGKSERDSWIVAVEKVVQDAKQSREGVVSSEDYKNNLSRYGKSAGVGAGAAAATKATISKPDDKIHDGTTENAVTTTTTSEPTKKDEKSRSQSRKRASIFGKYLSKKDEPEEKKAEKEQAKEEKKVEKELAKEERQAEKEEVEEEKKAEKAQAAEEKEIEKEYKKEEKKAEKEEKKHEKAEHKKEEEAAAIAAGTAAGTAVAAEESKPREEVKPKEEVKAKEEEKTPLKSKRGSVFGGMPFFGKKKEETPKKEDDVPPAVPAKDVPTQPVSETAPQLENPVKPEEATPHTATPAMEARDEPARDAAEVGAPLAAAGAAAAASHKNKENEKPESKGGLFGFLKQKEAQHEAKKEEKNEVKAEEKAEKENVKPAETTAAATATEKATGPLTPNESTLKEKRRSSFFSTLGKKDKKTVDANQKKSDSAVSDAEGTDSEKKSNKLQGLFRKASRSTKGANGVTADPDAPPVPAKESAVAKEGETAKDGEAIKENEAAKELPAVEEATTGHVPSNDTAVGAVPEPTAVPAAETTGNSAPAVAASA